MVIYIDTSREATAQDMIFVQNLHYLMVGWKKCHVHMDNKNEDTLILGEGPTQWLDDRCHINSRSYISY